MILKKGDIVPEILLVDVNDQDFDLKSYHGKKVLVSFYRFASCPFCNLRIHNIVKNYEKYNEHFEIVAIFESEYETLKNKMKKYKAPFKIMSDRKNRYYNTFGVGKSFWGMISGMIFRMPSLIKSMMLDNFPTNIDSSLIRMPADFLIDENGRIEIAYYGKDEGDHLDLNKLIESSR